MPKYHLERTSGHQGVLSSGDFLQAKSRSAPCKVSNSLFISQDGGETTPDPQISMKEDQNVRLTKENLAEDLAKHLELPLRPGYGGGKQFGLRTNYFDVNLKFIQELFKYDFQIEPISESARAIQNRRKRRQFFKILFEKVPDFQRRGAGVATDYANTLITRGRLFDGKPSEKHYEQVYYGEYDQTHGGNDQLRPKEQKFRVTVKSQGTISISEIIRYIGSEPTDVSDFSPRQDAIQALNIIMAGSPNKDSAMFQSSQNKFYQYPRNETNRNLEEAYPRCNLSGGLIAVRGFYSSIRTSTSRVLLNLNAQCTPFYPEINLLALKQAFRDLYPQAERRDYEEFISKLRVRTEYTKDGKERITKVMTIRGFSHPWVDELDSRGRQIFDRDDNIKGKGIKGVDVEWGTANSIRFECDAVKPARKLTVTEYFQQSEIFPMLLTAINLLAPQSIKLPWPSLKKWC